MKIFSALASSSVYVFAVVTAIQGLIDAADEQLKKRDDGKCPEKVSRTTVF